MKTKRRSEEELTVNLVGCDPVLFERIRASLRRSPFFLSNTDAPLPSDEVALYVVPAAEVEELPARGVPVIAWGPAGMMRAAFLGGCDDYLRDPWTPEELGLRAHAALSRVRPRCQFPWGEVSFEGDTLLLPGAAAALTHHESLILRALLRARSRPVPRTALAYSLDGTPRRAAGRVIDAHVSAIRRKVRKAFPDAGRFIVCIRGQGYMVP